MGSESSETNHSINTHIRVRYQLNLEIQFNSTYIRYSYTPD